jgi:nicotinamide mononucleotide transporter
LLAIEIVGVITGLACVWLAAREHIWNWPVAIVNVSLYAVVFWRSKLYADSALQPVFLLISIYGWWFWLRGGEARHPAPVRTAGWRACGLFAGATVLLWLLLNWVLRRFTDSQVPIWDSLTTALSLTAIYMQGRKLIENWLWWIVADVLYIALYAYKRLYPTSALYVVYIAICVAGWRRWKLSLSPAAVAQTQPVA